MVPPVKQAAHEPSAHQANHREYAGDPEVLPVRDMVAEQRQHRVACDVGNAETDGS